MFGDINERQEEYLHDIHSSGRHLLELLNEILDLSKIEAGKMALEYSSIDLRSLTATRAAIVQLAVPVLAAVGGVLFLGERISARLVIAAAMILGGIMLALSRRRSRT